MARSHISTQCCIAGGGPAGMMVGYLLARAGVDVVVLEKHADFLRDFRGDTVHPSTLQIMHELRLLEDFLKEPHQKVDHLTAVLGDRSITMVDFSRLSVPAPYIAFMPQWDFLDFLSDKAQAYRGFTLKMRAEVTGLTQSDGRVTGVTASTPDGDLEVTADLIIGADGRGSRVRDIADLKVTDHGAPIDVLWFGIPRHASDTDETQANFQAGQVLIMLNRGDYWQCAFVIPKGSFANVKHAGLAAFRDRLRQHAPFIGDRVDEISEWDKVKLLTVTVDHLETWHREGLVCIGDAAHAMSPVGGVGINLAIQDAVAAANILAPEFVARQRPKADTLARIAKRRLWPVRMIQRFQILLHKQVIYRTLEGKGEFKAPLFLRLVTSVPLFRRLMGCIIGMGFRVEHVDPMIVKPEFAKPA